MVSLPWLFAPYFTKLLVSAGHCGAPLLLCCLREGDPQLWVETWLWGGVWRYQAWWQSVDLTVSLLRNARVLLQPEQLYLCYLFELLLLLYQKYTPIPCFSTEVQTHTFLVFIVWRKRVFNITWLLRPRLQYQKSHLKKSSVFLNNFPGFFKPISSLSGTWQVLST